MVDTTGTGSGRTIAGYEVVELLGRGGMGEVYLAFDPRLERRVALKVLAPQLAEDEAFRERLLRESRLAAALDHPNVVPVYDAGEADGTLFIAMRYVDGTDLRRLLLDEGALPPERAIAIGAQLAGALDAAHARGLVHRDVKPSNVLVDHGEGREHCYLADFGLSQSVANRPTTDGELLGTVDYVAPEQIRGDAVDGRADEYAFGCLLYEALTGERPFAGSSDIATIYAHLEEAPSPASVRRPELPEAVDAVLARAMSKDPEERYESCGALVEDARLALGVAAPPTPRRQLVLVAMLVLVAVVAITAVLAMALRGEPTATPPGGSLVRIDPLSRSVAKRLSTPAVATHLVASPGQLWFSSGGSLWHMGSGSAEPEQVDTVGPIYDLAALGDTVFVAREGKSFLEGVVGSYTSDGFRGDGVGIKACSLAAGESVGVWAADCQGVHRLESTPGRLLKRQYVPIPPPLRTTSATTRWCLCDMAAGGGAIWAVGDADDPRMWRITPAGRIVATIDLPAAPGSIAVVGGSAWITAPLDDVVIQVDSATNRIVRRIPVGRGAAGIAAGAGAVWVANQLDGTVTRIDPAAGRVTDRIHVGGRPSELAFGDGGLWAAVDERA
jgi:YVTN family beta-propeller protein